MDLLDSEMLHLWRALEKHGVRYIMVGGFATNLHGFSRTTADLDLWLDDTIENRINLITALSELGLTNLESLKTTQLVPGWTSVVLPSGFELDLMTFIEGFEAARFEECYNLAAEAEIEDIALRFLHINHLIESKEATNRTKDQLDLIELKKLRDNA